jgi:hypothetical protein
MRIVLPFVTLLMGCNQYEMFRLAGHTQESFSNRADILFIVDNSDSMTEEASALAVNFEEFALNLVEGDEEAGTDDLSDAVNDYIRFVGERTAFVNYQLAVTTTDVSATYGELYGPNGLVTRGDEDVPGRFVENLLCDATCFPSCTQDDIDAGTCDKLPSGLDHECGDPIGEEVTQSYLECTCDNDWEGNCATLGQEEGLEAIFMALCRSVPHPPEECFDGINNFSDGDVMSNEGLLRDKATFMPIIISDEGDDSRRAANGSTDPGDPASALPAGEASYYDLFDKFHLRMSPVVIGPVYDRDAGQFDCPTGAANWGALRYDNFVRHYGGLYVDVTDPGNACKAADFSIALEQIGDLLKSLADSFPLQSVPDLDTVLVRVGHDFVEQAETNFDDIGVEVYGDGWSYRSVDNAIVLHGSAVPDFNTEVEIYYQPIDGVPRELPF